MTSRSSIALADAILLAIGANDEAQTVKTWLSTGFPPLDKAISGSYNGGMPSGRIVEMFGPASCGKTAISTAVMAHAQKAGGAAMFNDHERSFESGLAADLGLDLTPGRFVFKTPRTFEESVTNAIKFAQAARKVLPPEAPLVVVFDSLAAMVPKSKLAKELDEQGMNDSLALAKATSAVFPVLAQFAEEYQVLMLFLNQVREKPGVTHGDPTTTPGGKAPAFYASVRIQLGGEKLYEGEGANKQWIGQTIKAKCVKNKVSRAFEKAEWDFRILPSGKGHFDVTKSLVNHLCDTGAIATAGARCTWTDGKSYFRSVLAKKIDDEKLQAELRALCKDAV